MDSVEKSNQVSPKLYNGTDVGILFKFIKYDEGYLFKFINEADHYLLRETMEFDLRNCRIVGVTGNYLNFSVGPRSHRYVHIVPINKGYYFEGNLIREESNIQPC